MKIIQVLFIFIFALFFIPLNTQSVALAQESKVLQLPEPTKTGGIPLFNALATRKSHRGFSPVALPLEQLSTLLWAAFGVNRPDGQRTIPTAHDRRNLNIYTVLPSGVWLYDAEKNNLTLVLKEDRTGSYGGSPLTLLYASSTLEGPVGALQAGSAYQNVGLFCASESLANVVKTTGVDVLKNELTLPEGYQVMVVQSIGQPAGAGF